MSRSTRAWLLAGCGLLVLLEARRAGDSLGVAWAGPYQGSAQTSQVLAGAFAPEGVVRPLPVLLMLPGGAVPIAGWNAVGSR